VSLQARVRPSVQDEIDLVQKVSMLLVSGEMYTTDLVSCFDPRALHLPGGDSLVFCHLDCVVSWEKAIDERTFNDPGEVNRIILYMYLSVSRFNITDQFQQTCQESDLSRLQIPHQLPWDTPERLVSVTSPVVDGVRMGSLCGSRNIPEYES
jgi:hypothetical protein